MLLNMSFQPICSARARPYQPTWSLLALLVPHRQPACPDSEMNFGKEFIDILSILFCHQEKKKTSGPACLSPFLFSNLFVSITTTFLHFCNPSYQTWRNWQKRRARGLSSVHLLLTYFSYGEGWSRLCSIHEIWIGDTDTRYRFCI